MNDKMFEEIDSFLAREQSKPKAEKVVSNVAYHITAEKVAMLFMLLGLLSFVGYMIAFNVSVAKKVRVHE